MKCETKTIYENRIVFFLCFPFRPGTVLLLSLTFLTFANKLATRYVT